MFFNKDSLKALSLLSQLAVTMAAPIVLGLILGAFLDRKLGTTPIFLLVMILIGIAAGFRNVYHITQSFLKSPSQIDLKQEAVLKEIKSQEPKDQREGSEKDGDNETKTSENS